MVIHPYMTKKTALLSCIVAMDQQHLIGVDNTLPWRLPADLKNFRRLTMGKPIIMGRKTFDSIGKPLDGRINVVVTRDKTCVIEGCHVVHSIEEVRDFIQQHDECMLIGGSELYRHLLPYCDHLYITEVKGCFTGDAYFPNYDSSAWQELTREAHQTDKKNQHAFDFVHYQRKIPTSKNYT